MNQMKTILKTTCILVMMSLLQACFIDGFERITGNRKVVEKTRNSVSDFTKIKAGNGLDVYISQGKTKNIVVEADENLHDIIITEVEGETLKLYTDKNIYRAKSRKIYITAPTINAIYASSGSDVIVENTIKAKTFEAKTSSGADMTVRVETRSLTSSSSSGSDLEIIGKAQEYKVKTSSGSDTEAFKLLANTVTASASSGSSLEVYASKEINASASSGADIDVKGTPQNVNKNTSSGGSVSIK